MTWGTKNLTALLLASACFSAGAPAMAQSSGAELGEVVVTAQRRGENLQDVPIAVTAITAATAEKIGVIKPDVIAQLVPGLQLNSSLYGLTPFLRGVGTNSVSIGNEPSVALFVDDIYLPTGAAGTFQLNSVSSIEVLKGPQGTLFGRNATGGVIHIRTKDPTFEPTGSVAATYGNYDTRSGQFYGSTGLSDKVAVNIAGQVVDQRKGWGRNVPTNHPTSEMSGWGVRGKLLWEASADTSVLLSGSFDHRKASQGHPGRAIQGTFARNGYSADAAGLGFYDTMWDYDSSFKTETESLSAKITHDFGAARLVSISATSRTVADPAYVDVDSTPTPFFHAISSQGARTYTQELQLLSPDDAAVTWILGGFYLHDRAYYRANFFGQAFGGAAADSVGIQRTSSVSGFAQATGEIMPRTNLTLGLRYTSDHRKFYGLGRLIPPAGAATNFGPYSDQKTFSTLTGRVSIDHHFNDNVMGYVAYNRGFKSGIYNISGVSVGTGAVPPPVNPEDLNAYTVGLKTEFLDRRLRLNAEAYYYDYSNIQVSIVVPGGSVITNGGKATIKGFEVELAAMPMANLQINASLGVLDSRYDAFLNGPAFFLLPPNAPTHYDPAKCTGPNPYPAVAGAAPAVQRACDLTGKKLIQAPPFTSNIQAIYTIPMDTGDIDLSASWAHGGNYHFDAYNNPLTKQPKTDIVNGSIQWSAPGGRFTARLWANNLTGEKYYLVATTGTTGGAKYSAAAPRTYGVTLGANF